MGPDSAEKIARLHVAAPHLSDAEFATRWATFSNSEKVAFQAIIQAAKPVLSRIGGSIANGARAAGSAIGGMLGRGGAQAAGQAAKPGLLGRAAGAIGLGMTAASTGQAFMQGANPSAPPQPRGPTMGSFDPGRSKYASLTKQALGMGLHDAIDLGGYGALMAGPAAEMIAPEWAEHHRKGLLAADLAGLGILARHHIPGLQPHSIQVPQ